MNILVLQLKRIGDLVLTTPALGALRTIIPEARVTLAVSGSSSSLLPAIDGIDRAIVLAPGGGLAPWRHVLAGRWEVCLDFTGSDRSALAAALSRARRRIAFESVRKSKLRAFAYREFVHSPVRDAHTADHYLDLLRPLRAHADAPGSKNPEAAQPQLRLPDLGRAQARDALEALGVHGPYALIHPGTARPEKYWRADRWASVVDHLQTCHGLACVLSGGTHPIESAHLAEVGAAVSGGCLSVAGKTDLLTLAALAANARVVISGDTSIVHLAAAFQIPQITLYGPTNPFHWRPRHPRAVILSAAFAEAPLTRFEPRMPGAPMERLSTGVVIRAIDTLLAAPPGDRGEHGPRGASASSPFP
jgi:ADP-heptose:LPS heptosyltransferase